MASQINTIIPTQRFESIRDVIGLIIAEEFAKQKTLTSNTIFDATIWIERSLSFDAATELPAVNICYRGTTYSNKDMKSRLGDNVYSIEVTSVGYASATERGDKSASVKLHKLLGVIAYILSSPEYRFLGLNVGIVMQSAVKEIKIYPPDPVYNPTQSTDELSTVSGMILFSVNAAEEVGDMTGVEIDEIFSHMKIDNTEKGYKITIINS